MDDINRMTTHSTSSRVRSGARSPRSMWGPWGMLLALLALAAVVAFAGLEIGGGSWSRGHGSITERTDGNSSNGR